jgi:hypothetical protein
MALSKIDVANMLTGVTPVANGGTGQTTFAAAGLAKRPNAKPIIVNGNMAMSQRTTSTAGVTSTAYGACDRMQLVNNTMGTYTVIQESLTSGAAYEAGFHNAWRIDCTTADSSPAAGDVLYPRYKIESQDLSMFKKGTSEAEAFTIAFWVKSNKTGNAQVNFYDIDNTRLCAGTYTISSANTWEHKVINIAADTTGAWADDNGEGLRIEWRLDSGSNSTSGTTPTAWEAAAAGDRDVAGQLQIARSTDNDWAITGIQLEVGTYTSSTLPPFQHESYGDNLARCQRYYYRINPDADAQASIGEASMYSSSAAFVCLEFPVAMRDSPSLEQTTGTNYFNLNRNSANDNFNTFNNLNASDHTSAHLYISADISGTAGHGARCRFENASARLAFSAEL